MSTKCVHQQRVWFNVTHGMASIPSINLILSLFITSKTNKKKTYFVHHSLDPELPKPLRPSSNNFQKSKLNRIRSNALRQNRGELYNQTTFSTDEWIVKSGCHFSCLENSMGIQIISSKSDHSTNIQLCNAEFIVNILNTHITTDIHTRLKPNILSLFLSLPFLTLSAFRISLLRR